MTTIKGARNESWRLLYSIYLVGLCALVLVAEAKTKSLRENSRVMTPARGTEGRNEVGDSLDTKKLDGGAGFEAHATEKNFERQLFEQFFPTSPPSFLTSLSFPMKPLPVKPPSPSVTVPRSPPVPVDGDDDGDDGEDDRGSPSDPRSLIFPTRPGTP